MGYINKYDTPAPVLSRGEAETCCSPNLEQARHDILWGKLLQDTRAIASQPSEWPRFGTCPVCKKKSLQFEQDRTVVCNPTEGGQGCPDTALRKHFSEFAACVEFVRFSVLHVDDAHAQTRLLIEQTLIGLPVTVRRAGLSLSDEATESQCEDALRRLLKLNKKATVWFNFALGDLWRQMPVTYGAKRRAAETIAGGEVNRFYQNMKRCAWVAHKWPEQRREVGWSWSFYRETANMDEATQDYWMGRYRKGDDPNLLETIRQQKGQMVSLGHHSGTKMVSRISVTPIRDTVPADTGDGDEADEFADDRPTLPGLLAYDDLLPDLNANTLGVVGTDANGVAAQIVIPPDELRRFVDFAVLLLARQAAQLSEAAPAPIVSAEPALQTDAGIEQIDREDVTDPRRCEWPVASDLIAVPDAEPIRCVVLETGPHPELFHNDTLPFALQDGETVTSTTVLRPGNLLRSAASSAGGVIRITVGENHTDFVQMQRSTESDGWQPAMSYARAALNGHVLLRPEPTT